MESLEQVRTRLAATIPGAAPEIVANAAVPAQASLRVERAALRAVAEWLRSDPQLRMDYCSNVTGVDWPERVEKVKVRKSTGTEEKEVEETRTIPGCLEVVYHLYSMSLGHGPVILRVRTGDRAHDTSVASLTPVWRSCELQEREIFDLFGVGFEGHPDLRRLLMWEGFEDHPMRKDYVEPDDYEYEPTAHDHVLERAQARSRREAEA